MNTFSEGDLVEATRSHTLIRGRLNGLGQMPGVGRSPEALALDGYTVRLLEKAAPALPTAEGVYQSRTGAIWVKEPGLPLRWAEGGGGSVNPENYTPFTRLEPVADTAKTLRAEFGRYPFNLPVNARAAVELVWDQVFKTLGVTS